MEQKSYRGKGTSRKLTKDGKPKRAGNWSFQAIHLQSLQSRDYHVRRINDTLIVGDHTKLSSILGEAVAVLAENNTRFDYYVEKGQKQVGLKKYDAERSLKRFAAKDSHSYLDFEFIYLEQIYTDGDFDYNFPDY